MNFLAGIRVFIAAFYAFTIWYDVNYVGMKFDPSVEKMEIFMAGRLMYLTVWNMIFTIIYQLLAAINDLFGTNEIAPKRVPFIRKARDYLFAAILLPASMFVGVTFWTLFFIDRELIFPSRVDEFMPSWVNHTMHTFVIFLVTFELFLSFRKYPSKKQSLIGIVLGTFAYLTLLHVAHRNYGKWAYPILAILGDFQRSLLFAGLFVFGFAFYVIGESLNNIYWKKELKIVSKKKSNKSY